MPTRPSTEPSRAVLDGEASPDHRWLTHRSVEIITALQDPSGAYPAAPTFSAYQGYAWLRDGSFTAEAMSRWGERSSADRFHRWVSGVLVDRGEQVARLVAAANNGDQPNIGAMLPTRFTLDGRDGTDEWWDFQTDGYGMWLWALECHLRRHQIPAEEYLPAIAIAVDYLTTFGGDACYDWWEEHNEHRHISTLAAVRAGLVAAGRIDGLDAARRRIAAEVAAKLLHTIINDGRIGSSAVLAKWIGSDTVDGSLPACVVPFGLLPVDHPTSVATLDAVAATLDHDGGVHRFSDDVFYGGGQWLLLSCLLGWNRAAAGDLAAAWRYLNWAAGQATSAGELPEQVADHLLHPEHRQTWIDRWGTVARPLLWSHAMYLILADELGPNDPSGETDPDR